MSGATGWKAESYDSRDLPYRSSLNGKMEHKVDLSARYPKCFDPVFSQGTSRSCVANATAAAYRFLATQQAGLDTQDDYLKDPSRLFIYYMGRLLDADPTLNAPYPTLKDEGCYVRNAMKGIAKSGVCHEPSWPYTFSDSENHVKNVNVRPLDAVITEAKGWSSLMYSRLDPDHPDEVEAEMNDEERRAVGVVTLMQLKQCLTEGYPVVFGFNYYWPEPPWIKKADGWVLPALAVSEQHKGPPAGSFFGGHSVVAIGYDEDKKMVLCQNSWGKDWSANGKFWIDYNWIKDWEATDDFWMIREIAFHKK